MLVSKPSVKRIILIFILYLISKSSYSQKLDIKHINYAEGFSSTNITVIKQDQFGFLWSCTAHGGLYRWDGSELKSANDSLEYSSVFDLLITERQKYISTFFSVIHRINHENKIEASVDLKTELEQDRNRISKLFIVDDRIIAFSLVGYAFILNSKSLEILQKIVLPNSFFIDKVIQSGKFFLLINNTSYIRLSLDDALFFSEVPKVPKPLASLTNFRNENQAFKSVIVSDQKIYLQSTDSLFVMDQDLNIKKKYYLNLKDPITCILKKNEEWWIGSLSGLFRYSEKGINLSLNEIVLKQATKMLLDHEEGIWVATMVGIYRIKKKQIELKEDVPFEGPIYGDFLKVGETIWALRLYRGIDIHQKGKIIDSINLGGSNFGLLRFMFQYHTDSIYLGSSRGLLSLNIRDKKYKLVDNLRYSHTSIASKGDTLFFGTARNGVLRKVGNDIEKLAYYKDSISIGYTTAIVSDNNHTFASTDEGVMQIIDGNFKKLDLQLNDNLPPFSLMLKDQNQLWIGSASSGIIIYDLVEKKVIRRISTPSLSSNTINFLFRIDGRIWVATNKGVDIVQEKFDSYTIYKLSDVSSLASAETLLTAVEKVGDKVWIGTDPGTLIIPRNIIETMTSKKQSKVIIESITYGQDNIMFIPKSQDSIPTLEIPYSEYEIDIAFNSMNYDNITTTYSYRMINYDRDTSKVQRPKLASYKRLPPGFYKFEVWEDKPYQQTTNKTSFSIRILAPFYRTPLFILVSIISVVILLVFLIRWFILKKEKRFLRDEYLKKKTRDEIRNEIAIDFHDEMGNHLAKIINLSGALKLQNVPKKFVPTIDKIEENAKSLFSSTSNLIWSLKSQNNYFHEIIILIKNFAENLFDQSNTVLAFNNLKNHMSHHRLEARRSRDITLIIKEILTNIYKHASAKNVVLTFGSSDKLSIIIEDDGIGFNQKNNYINGGISNMYKRANRSNIEITISSNTGQDSGTRVSLIIKND